MRKVLVAAVVGACIASWSSAAQAQFGVQLSLGTGLTFGGSTEGAGTNLELIPSWAFGPIFADVGIFFGLERERALHLRPGVRINLNWLYLRAAIPLRATGKQDVGLLLALGKLFMFENMGISIEVGKQITRNLGAGAAPMEFRLGMQFLF